MLHLFYGINGYTIMKDIFWESCDWVAWRRGSRYLHCHPGLWRPVHFSLCLWQSKCTDVTHLTFATDVNCRQLTRWVCASSLISRGC